jgi:hypothetical protein
MPSPQRIRRAPTTPRSRSFWLVAALIAGLLFAGFTRTDALADPVAATLDSTDVTLTPKDGGGWTAAVGLTNLTNGDLTITATADPNVDGCEKLTLGENGTPEGTLPAAHHAEMTVTAGSTCPSDKAVGLSLEIGATAKPAATATPAAGATPAATATPATGATPAEVQKALAVTATPKKAQPVNWKALSAFIYASGAALALMLIVYAVWAVVPWSNEATGKHPLVPLAGLTASWTFKDSVASNLTAASGLVAVFLGSSDFLKSALGPKAEAAIAGAAIAGAVALALVGAAGVLALTVRWPSSKFIAIGGLLLGTALALGAAGGQVWAVTALLADVDLGSIGGTAAEVAKWAATALLVFYGFFSVYGFLQQGTTKVDQDPLAAATSEIATAAIGAAAAAGQPLTYENVTTLIGELVKPDADDDTTTSPPKIVMVAQPHNRLPLSDRSALP